MVIKDDLLPEADDFLSIQIILGLRPRAKTDDLKAKADVLWVEADDLWLFLTVVPSFSSFHGAYNHPGLFVPFGDIFPFWAKILIVFTLTCYHFCELLSQPKSRP